jgi:hypothetical protein
LRGHRQDLSLERDRREIEPRLLKDTLFLPMRRVFARISSGIADKKILAAHLDRQVSLHR